ncbi:MAG: MBG domain-containing protein, partial [Brevundimonas sp.]|nr:MBG domain-containing protein [Brevundimonas sp.]
GENGGTITQAYVTGAVTGTTANVGGLVGWNNSGGSITQAYATGTVMGEISVGGLVGINDGGSITQAYATGRVEGSGSFVGGLMGYNGGVVTQAYATGRVEGSGSFVGGLVGFNFGTIEQAYATGVVTGGSNVGGLVGQNFGPGAVTQSYWNTDPNGALPGVGSGSSTGATGLTTAQMQDITSFATTYAGWDFATIWSPPNQVGQSNNSDTAYYPQLYGVGPVLPVAFAPSLSATSREYGDSNPTASFTVAGLRAGDSIGTQPSLTGLPGASADVGTYAVSASGGALNAPSGATYRLIYLPRSLTVTPRLITVTPDSGPSREYGDANPTLTYALSRTTAGASGAALVNGDTLGGALASAADGTSNVGNYAITQGNLAGSGNYTITFIGGQTMAVTPRLITVTADAQSRQYGDANPTLSFATARTGGGIGLVNDDRLDGALSTLATQTSNIGSYAITLGSLTGSNYALTYVGNNLTVTPRLITVRANDLARNNNSANPPLTYRITSGSLANGDSFAGSLSTNAELQSQAGSYAITQGSLALSANYAMSFLPGTLTVTQGSLTLSANYAMSLVPGTLPVRPTAVMSNGEFGSTLAAWMNENGQMFWMRRGNTQWPFSTTDMSFGTAFMTELLSSGGVNVR